MAQERALSTGMTGLDRVLKGLMAGDNIVWQVDSVDDYVPFVKPYYEHAVKQGRKVIYFRFARHDALIEDCDDVEIHTLQPEAGFETFLSEIHRVIEEAGRGAFYIFDCLSDLAVDWYSDRMVGNFFKLTCPYLYDLETITYFALLKDGHSFHATTPISETTQLLLDVYRHRGRLYVHPLKVQHRYSPTMHMLHVWDDDTFSPVLDSCTIAEIHASTKRSPLDSAASRLGVWNRAFVRAQEFLTERRHGRGDPETAQALSRRLVRMIVSRDDRVVKLAEKHFTLEDLVQIGRRMIGTGLVGGKSVGMLLARAILKQSNPRWEELLEVHDSFYIGSDVFYTFLVRNGCWWERQRQRDPASFLEGAERARQRILTGSFPDYIENQLESMLDYYGQSPIIVRSSSLLEDNFGNAFAGKYDSIFCVNQGSRHKRLEDLISAIKAIYASTMSERALVYRARRGILDRDEQMALLVQRVSGGVHGSFFYPHLAGVAFSFNPFVWSEHIDPEAGMLRLVFGLGTRAVDRSDDDYTRLVALNAPERRPESGSDKVSQYAQRKVDVLDLEANLEASTDFTEAYAQDTRLPLHLFTSRDEAAERAARQRGVRGAFYPVLTFDHVLKRTPFVEDMRNMAHTIQDAYDYPVDIEFTANFLNEDEYRINLVQCRPLQVKGSTAIVDPPSDITDDALILRTHGPVIGQSRIEKVDRIILISPFEYGQMPVKERYTIARLIGEITHIDGPHKAGATMLLGPGRWGTTTPSLGVPVSFAEINTVSVVCEIVAMTEDLIPDVSLGTHFFSDLVETDMMYLALFPDKEESLLNETFLDSLPNRLAELLPRASAYTHVIKVVDSASLPKGQVIRLNANTLKQRALCYIDSDS